MSLFEFDGSFPRAHLGLRVGPGRLDARSRRHQGLGGWFLLLLPPFRPQRSLGLEGDEHVRAGGGFAVAAARVSSLRHR